MEKKYPKSEKEYIDMYQSKGFTNTYRIEDNMLVDLNTKARFHPADVYILAEHRFEGETNPSDMSILYAIKTKDGHKGTVLANYSPAVTTDMAKFFNLVPKENVSQKAK